MSDTAAAFLPGRSTATIRQLRTERKKSNRAAAEVDLHEQMTLDNSALLAAVAVSPCSER